MHLKLTQRCKSTVCAKPLQFWCLTPPCPVLGHWKVCESVGCSVVSNSVTPWTVTCKDPLSNRFSQGHWSGLFPSPGDLPKLRIKPMSPVAPALQADFLPLNQQGSPICKCKIKITLKFFFLKSWIIEIKRRMMAVKGMREKWGCERNERCCSGADTFSYEMNELRAPNVLPHGYSSHRIIYFQVAQRRS